VDRPTIGIAERHGFDSICLAQNSNHA